MVSSNPLVFIGVPAYNRPEGLRNTLVTLCSQSYPNIEIHVSDDCSPNPLVNEIIQKFCLKDPRVIGYRQSVNNGIISNHEFLLSKISPDAAYVMWACDDDDWHPDYIKTCVEALEKNPGAILCTTASLGVQNGALCQIQHNEQVDTLGMIDPVDRYKKVLPGILWSNHTFYGLLRRSVYEKLTLQRIFAFDVLFIAQLSLLGQFIQIRQPYFVKAIGGNGSELRQNLNAVGDRSILSRYFPRLGFFLKLRRAIKNSSISNPAEKRQLLISSFKSIAGKSIFDKTVMDKGLWFFRKGINALKFAATWLKVKHFRSAWLLHIHRLPASDFTFSKKEQKLYSKNLQSVFTQSSDLFRNYHEFLDLKEQNNAHFTYDSTLGKNLVTISNICFELRESFYGYLLHEIFARQVYRLELESPAIVIDIGSNVGISALYFAKQPQIKKVFGFEPFPKTAEAALDNFNLNPQLKSKIHLEQFALSDREETLSVDYSFATSQLSSIKKSKDQLSKSVDFEPVKVWVQKASKALAPVLREYKNEKKVLKIDTEGSEDEIVRNLNESGLLTAFDYIMIEWHGASRKTLEHALENCNFNVSVTDENYSSFGHTGMIYARNKHTEVNQNHKSVTLSQPSD